MNKNLYNTYAIIIQARLNSTRLKNKILKKIHKNLTILDFLIIRLLKVFKSNKIIFALAKNPNNSKIINILDKYKIKYFEGSENNVLKRYFDCAKIFGVRNIIRVTSDCPLVDPYLIKNMYKSFRKNKLDYLANTLPEKNKKYPDGSDIEIFTFAALKKMYKLKLNKHDREHVTNKFWDSGKFKKKIFFSKIDFSQYRYSLDYQSDLTIIKFIIVRLRKLKQFGFVKEIVNIIDKSKVIKKIMHKNMTKQHKRRINIF
tara:strand:+ start:227 stop:1000 length:774 start_codon:yes stop_codon:yes gene_type:complete